MTNGIDISEFQGDVNFDLLNTQIDFIFIRCSFGVGYMDNKFERNRNESRRVGISRGFYHYAYPQYNSPEEEANYFCSVLSDLEKDELVALDFEEQWSGDKVNWCLRFLNRVHEVYGFKPLLYTNLDKIYSAEWTAVVNADYGLWLATWDGNNSIAPSTPWPFVAFKQYSSTGSISGIEGNVDFDVFFGDKNSLKKYGYQPPINIPDPIEDNHNPPINIHIPVSNPIENKEPAFVIDKTDPTDLLKVFRDLLNKFLTMFR
ncbi:MAG: glycoside hydrolase family 25 protein [Candidatus Dojkabacteria bacterium]